MSADWGSFFNPGARSSIDEPKNDAVGTSGDDEVVEADQGNGTFTLYWHEGRR